MKYWINQYAVAPDQPGGTRHFEMARHLNEQGVPICLVASDLNLTLREYLRRRGASDRRRIHEVIEGVPVVWLPAGDYDANDWRRALSMVTFSLWVFWHLLSVPVSRTTSFIGSTPHLLAAAATWIAARIRRVPFVLEVRDLWPESMVGVSGERGLLVPALRVLSDVLYRRADAIVVLAKPNIDRLVERGAGRSKISYIPNGVDADAFEAESSPCSIALPEDRKVFAYTGAHGPANGLDVAVRAGSILEERGEDEIEILLVGDGPAKESLRALAAEMGVDNVRFEDPIPKSEIPSLLEQCHGALMLLADVEVFRYGVSPNKLFDYLMASVPVIANVPGAVERIVEEAEGGVVIQPADPEALADAISKLARGDRWRTPGPEYIRANHDRRMLTISLSDTLEELQGPS